MAKISYTWFDDAKTILLCTYPSEEWGWEDFYEAFEVQNAMIDTVDHIVHVIVDTRASHWMPRGGSLLSGMRKLTDLKHPRQGHTIIVGASGLIASVVRMVTNLMGKQRQEMHLVDTMDDAVALLDRLLESANAL